MTIIVDVDDGPTSDTVDRIKSSLADNAVDKLLARTGELYKQACLDRGYGSGTVVSDQVKALARATIELLQDVFGVVR